ncbi:hypothetical protein HYT02_02500 [Candidatus Gottesmanbacteria bacterium]|nr:hypothetical protein [Candidatus Gottesmanbacteria bacterium]
MGLENKSVSQIQTIQRIQKAQSLLENQIVRMHESQDPEMQRRMVSGFQAFIGRVFDQPNLPPTIFFMSTEDEIVRAKTLIVDVLKQLHPLEAEVIVQRFSLDGEKRKTLLMVSQSLGYQNSGERARQLEARGLRSARRFLRQHELSPLVFQRASSASA